MSLLAFDKHGKPFAFDRATTQLFVRVFKNPSARGTCSRVLDADGEPLSVEADIGVAEFRKRVGYVPGLYRLDQCDEDGNELEDAPPAYISIDAPRNGVYADGGNGDVSPLVIIQQMAAVQADVMKTMSMQHAALMAAAAEIMRAPYRPAPAALPAPELRNADAGDDERDDDDDDDSDEEEATPEHPATVALRMLEPHLPQLGGFLYEKCAEFLRTVYSKKAATSPAATPAPMSVPAPTIAPPTSQPIDDRSAVAAGPTAPPPPPQPVATAPTAPIAPAVQVDGAQPGTAPIATDVPTETTDSAAVGSTKPVLAAGSPDAASIAPPIPTRQQFEHLTAIRARLSPAERAIAQETIARMEPRMLADWLSALSAMSVDEAAALIRRMVAEIQPPRPSKPR